LINKFEKSLEALEVDRSLDKATNDEVWTAAAFPPNCVRVEVLESGRCLFGVQ